MPFWNAVNHLPYAIGSLSCLFCLSVTLMYCGQTGRWIKMPLGVEVGTGNIVLHGDPAPIIKEHSPPPTNFWPMSVVANIPNGWMDQDATWYWGRPRPRRHCVNGDPTPPNKRAQQPPFLCKQVDLSPGHIVFDGDPSPSQKRGHGLQFLTHASCGQMTGWIKMPLGNEVGVGPSDIVLDGDPAPP